MPPYDNTLVLGQLVDMNKIKRLEELATIELPVKIADRKLNQLIMSERKLNGIHQQMSSFIPKDDTASLGKLKELSVNLKKLKEKIGKAAESLISETMTSMEKRSEKRKETTTTKIGESIESPIDFTISAVANHPLSFDSMEFDVQYFRNEGNTQNQNTTSSEKNDSGSQGNTAGQAQNPTTGATLVSGDTGAKLVSGDTTSASGDTTGNAADNAKANANRLTNAAQSQAFDANYKGVEEKVSGFVRDWLSNQSAKSFADFASGNTTGDIMATMDASGQSLNAQTKTVGVVNDIMTSQTQKHNIEGTLVIVANCNHKSADVISPCVLDPVKLFNAWNYTFPKDKLSTEPSAMFEVALTPRDRSKKNPNALHLLTGCTRASSFIGMCHVLQQDSTSSSQNTDSQAKQIKTVVDQAAALGYKTGQTRERLQQASSRVQKMLSSSSIYNHCSLVTQGIIPNINASQITQTVKQFSPTAGGNLSALANIMAASDKTFKETDSASAAAAKAIQTSNTGGKVSGARNDFASQAVDTIAATETKSKVIDTNSLMTAFTDYITKAQAGGCGIPVNFFIRKIDKAAVARCYICCFYPNGITTNMDAQKGAMGYKAAK